MRRCCSTAGRRIASALVQPACSATRRCGTSTGPSTGPARTDTPTPAAAPPSAEDYRALLLDLLLYRRETLEPVLEALRTERAEVERQMRLLDAQVRELGSIRDELRELAEAALEEEQAQLHRLLHSPDTATPPASPAPEAEVEIAL